jgi:Flp pilus assembly protein TadG
MMRTLRNRLHDERGISIIIVALGMVGLMGIAAIVVDVGNANQRSRSAQSVADASALAAGWDLPTAAPARTTAAAYVTDNLGQTLPAPVTCPVGDTITADTVCYRAGSKRIWITTPWEASPYLVRVEVCDDVDTTFAKVIGFNTVTVCRDAVAQVEPPVPATPGGPAIQAFSPDAKKALVTTSAGTIWTDGNILIGSADIGEAFDTDGTGGVSVVHGGQVWYNLQGGGCVNLPTCGPPGFINPAQDFPGEDPPTAVGAQPVGCNPDQTSLPEADRCATATFFDDVYIASAPTTIVDADLQACLTTNGAACTAYDLNGVPVTHAERFVYDFGDAAHVRTGTVSDPTCLNGYTEMDPGYYADRVKIGIAGGCVQLNPGIYMFAGGVEVCCDGYIQGNAVFLYNAHTGSGTMKFTKAAVCLTAAQDGPYANFLSYQNPLNTELFILTSDSVIHLGGIMYNPSGGIEVNGAEAGTVGGPGECLGESTTIGGSIVGTTVKVKSDGSLSITALEGTAASGGGGWVRLYE